MTDLASDTKFMFSGSTRVKNRTITVGFLSSNLNFIPISIIRQFQNISSLQLKNCRIPETVEHKFFQRFSQITKLTVASSNIKYIREDAFATLHKLEKIWLNDNQLETIDNIFKNNFQLKFIHLGDNKITKLTPALFHNLNYLKEFYFENNICADDNFENLENDMVKLQRGLKGCFVR